VVEKEIGAETLDRVVPSMLLQPLVENSIKHGFADKVDPGRILLRSTRQGEVVVIEVIDNGIGINAERLTGVMNHGIGLRNVNERLRVIYGASCQLHLHSVAGVGTSVRLEVPHMAAPERISA
jgi:two-component system LytT family sensor kinase